MKYDLCVIGGFGHIGLPLAIAFADKGLKTCALDISKKGYKSISKGKMPFIEEGAEPLLKKVLKNNMLELSLDQSVISESKTAIIIIGTPIDIHMTPEKAVEKLIDNYYDYFRDGQLLVLRSTIFPGTTERIYHMLNSRGKKLEVAFCPERIVEGHALEEYVKLPQLVSATTKAGEERAAQLFGLFTNDIIIVSPKEAELAKLFSNAWRYIKFGTANQFFILANEAGVDYHKLYKAMTYKYPRAQDLPGPGFAAGPCLFKDTAQLNAFSNHNFHVGYAATQVNESMPSYVIRKLSQKHDLKNKKVGVLGLSFKAESDDNRDSLSYKLLRNLEFEAKEVFYSDPYVKEPGSISAEELVNRSDIIILATPHKTYKNLKISPDKVLIDVWNFYGREGVI